MTIHRRARRSIRLRDHDYTGPGAYFVTICTHDRTSLFGDVADGDIVLNDVGEIARQEWQKTAAIRQEVSLDAFVVMPNHIHAVVWIRPDADAGAGVMAAHGVRASGIVARARPAVGAHGRAPLRRAPPRDGDDSGGPDSGDRGLRRPPRSLGALIAGYKAAVTRQVNALRGTPGLPVWQRNYYERIIRDQASLDRIRRYIADNPRRWHLDSNNPAPTRGGRKQP